MQNTDIIPAKFDIFDNPEDKMIANLLAEYILFGTRPTTSPALWQDVAIYIRYKKRDVWSLSHEQLTNARIAICIYAAKYIIEHLKTAEILKIFKSFFNQDPKDDSFRQLSSFFEQTFHAPVESLFLTQERIVINKDSLGTFDSLFDYPCWLEFTDEANEAVFDKILHNKLTDEQIDYFLGASDEFHDYAKWFKVAKHILTTTHDSHVFWTAGDVLSIIWKAVPADEKSQKWFKDQIYEIFWPRVSSTWPLLNEEKVVFEYDEETRILRDSIWWLRVLDDLKERLPELGKDYELFEHNTDEKDFAFTKGLLLGKVDSGNASFDEMMNLFFELTDLATSKNTVSELKEIADKHLIPKAPKYALTMINRAIKHAEKYLKAITRESNNLSKLISQSITPSH